MDLLSYLAGLEGAESLDGSPADSIVRRWFALERDHQAAANAYRLLAGKALADRLDAVGYGQKGKVLDAWVAMSERSASTWQERASVARTVWSYLEKYPELSRELDYSVLDGPWSELLGRLEDALGLERTRSTGSDTRGPWRAVQLMFAKVLSLVGTDRPALEKLRDLARAFVAELDAQLAEEPEETLEEVLDEPTLTGELHPEPARVSDEVPERVRAVEEPLALDSAELEGPALRGSRGRRRRGRRTDE